MSTRVANPRTPWSPGAACAAGPREDTVLLFHTNDLHGHIEMVPTLAGLAKAERRLDVPDELLRIVRHGRERQGRGGPGVSVYFRDPDGSLLELISYSRG